MNILKPNKGFTPAPEREVILNSAAKGRPSRLVRGFTIIELLIAMTLFIIITTIAVTIFTRTLRAQNATVGLIGINDNASLTMEEIVREVRTGSEFSIGGEGELLFTNAKGEAVSYYRSDSKIIRETVVGAVPLTAENIRVTRLVFELTGGTESAPARVTVSMTVGSFARDLTEIFTTMQTTISPRLL